MSRTPPQGQPKSQLPNTPAAEVLPALSTAMQHPRANQRIVLQGCPVAYELKHSTRRRSIGLLVNPQGLSVRAPQLTPLPQVQALLQRKAHWVLSKLQLAQTRAGLLAVSKPAWTHGQELRYLGQPLRLVLESAPHPTATLEPPCPQTCAALRLELAQPTCPAQVEHAVKHWFIAQARQVFAQKLAHFAPRVGVQPQKLRISQARTRWGSASSQGTISLNWQLIHLPPDLIDYVVVHELSHLIHMNHSPAFWAVVARLMPDHLQRRKALRLAAHLLAP